MSFYSVALSPPKLGGWGSEPLHPYYLLSFIICSYYRWATPVGSISYVLASTPASPAPQADTGLLNGEVSDFKIQQLLSPLADTYLAKEEGCDSMIRVGEWGRTVGLLFLWGCGVRKGRSDPQPPNLGGERASVQTPVAS